MNERQLKDLQKKLDYTFNNQTLLETALTHSSYANEKRKGGTISNERLEFLGDSVLGMTVALLIYSSKPSMPEGQMTRLRSELVCEKSLVSLAVSLGLGECMKLGHGEEKSGWRKRPSMLADAVEAVLAAMFLDGGFAPVERFVSTHFGSSEHLLEYESTDYKTALQEVIQEKSGRKLSYQIVGEAGPDHMKSYTADVKMNGRVIGSGIGRSKKEAEQAAARMALAEISK